jgi:hypothetical protein
LNSLLEWISGTNPTIPPETIEAKFTFINSEKGTFEIPPSPIDSPTPGIFIGDSGLVDIVVVNVEEDGQVARFVLQDAFRYDSLPEILSIIPTSGPESGGNIVRILGSNFKTTSIVSIFGGGVEYVFRPDGDLVPFQETFFISENELQVIMPDRSDNGLPELVSFQVSNSEVEETATLIPFYRYLDEPIIGSVTTSDGSNTGLTSGARPDVPEIDIVTTIKGSNFREISTDFLIINEELSDNNTFDGVETTFTVAKIPIVKHDGVVDDTATPADDPSDILSVEMFDELENPVPVSITAVDGATGQVTLDVAPENGWSVLITYYYNELKRIKVFFGTREAVIKDIYPSPVADTIEVYYPPNSEGVYDLLILNPDNQTATTTFEYERNDKPVIKLNLPENLVSGEDLNTTYPDEDTIDLEDTLDE